MVERFEQFRLSLLARPQRDLLEGTDPSREDYLRKVFAERYSFMHYANEFHYVPHQASTPEVVVGRVGRAVVTSENLPPERELEEVQHPHWRASVVLIDPIDHEDGQKVAFQINADVGKPQALITALVTKINETHPNTAYHIECQPLFDESDFWEFVKNNDELIVQITFDLVAPNGLFSVNSSLKDELRQLNQTTKSQEVTTTLKNEDGLAIRSKPIEDAVTYAHGAGGKIRAKAKNKKKFNSTTKPKTSELPKAVESDEELVVRAARLVHEIFGRRNKG